MWACVYVQVHICAHACVNERLTEVSLLNNFPPLVFEIGPVNGPAAHWSKQTEWLMSFSDPYVPINTSCEDTSMSYHAEILHGFWESELRSSHLHKKHFFFWLRHLVGLCLFFYTFQSLKLYIRSVINFELTFFSIHTDTVTHPHYQAHSHHTTYPL